MNPLSWLGNTVGSLLGNVGGAFKQGFGSGFGSLGGQDTFNFSPEQYGLTDQGWADASIGDKAAFINATSRPEWNQNNPMQWINTMGNLGLGLAQYNRAGDIFDFKKDAWKADQNAARKTYNTNRGDKLASRWSFAGGEDRNYNDQYDKDKLDYV